MADRHPLSTRLRYRWDTLLARGTIAVIAWLGIVTLLLIVVAGAVIQILDIRIDGERPGFFEGVWLALVRAMDAAALGESEGTAFRAVSFTVTLGGIFIVTALIGLVATGIDRRLVELRKGRSNVVESDHTVILGWSSKLFTILAELAIANASKKDACVVVMAPRDRVEMEDEIRVRAGKLRTTRVVCRTGDPSDPGDIAIVDPANASSVIVLQSDEEAPDAAVVRTVLALMRVDPALERLRVVAEFNDPDNAAAISEVTGGKVLTVVSSHIIARITAQVCRQPGLSVVFQDLLDFAGAELYLVNEPRLVGRSFDTCIRAYPTSTVIGIRRHSGETLLAPPADTVLSGGDRVVVLAEDDSAAVYVEPPATEKPAGRSERLLPRPAVDRILVVGWNDLGPMILAELDDAVAAGSVVDVLADPVLVGARSEAPAAKLERLRVQRHDGDTGSQANLARLLADNEYDRVIVLCYGGLRPADADARTLVTLLQLHQLIPQHQPAERAISVVSQLLDGRDVELARSTSANDFVVSERLTSFVLAQLAEDPERGTILRDLFDVGGSDISLQPASAYLEPDQKQPFAAVVEQALAHGHVAIGYRLGPGSTGGDARVVVNPPKSELVRLTADDQLIVIGRVDVDEAVGEALPA